MVFAYVNWSIMPSFNFPLPAVSAKFKACSLFIADYGKKLFIPYTAKLEECHIKSKATGLDSKNNTVTLESGETVKYTDLIIATGTSSPFPGKLGIENKVFSKDATLERYSELRKEVKIPICFNCICCVF